MTYQPCAAPSPDPLAPASPDAEGPTMPQTPAQPPAERFNLEVDGVNWLAYASGGGAYGTGHLGLAPIIAVHFALADSPDQPRLEALLGAGRLAHLFPGELLALFRSAREVVRLEAGAAPPRPRRFGLEG